MLYVVFMAGSILLIALGDLLVVAGVVVEILHSRACVLDTPSGNALEVTMQINVATIDAGEWIYALMIVKDVSGANISVVIPQIDIR